MPKPRVVGAFEVLDQGEPAKECSLRRFLLKADIEGPTTCQGPNEGNGVIEPGQRHYVVRFKNKKTVQLRCCGIECYDEYKEKAAELVGNAQEQ